MCIRIATKDLDNLQSVFEVAQRIEAKRAKKAASEASTGDGVDLQCGSAGEPTSSAVTSIDSTDGELVHEVDLR